MEQSKVFSQLRLVVRQSYSDGCEKPGFSKKTWFLNQRFWLLLLLATGLAGIIISSASTRAAPPLQADPAREAWVISYAEATGWLNSLPIEEQEEQIRDYALLGLAGILGLNVDELRDALYDQTPVRNQLFWDLAANRTGPGRGLLGRENTLHVLAPADDSYAARTIGLVLDDHRKDSGSDPAQVVLYRYTIEHDEQQVLLQPEPAQTAAEVRQAHGYMEMPITTLDELNQFLARTQHLSTLAIVEGELWAGGWEWPEPPSGAVSAADLTVLQRGYLDVLGAPVTVAEFITTVNPEEYGLDVVIPANVERHAAELDTFFTALAQVGNDGGENSGYVEFLTEYEDVVLELILDRRTALRLERNRATLDENAWFTAYAEAFADAVESNELWSLLWYVGTGDFRLPEADATEPGFSLDPGPSMQLAELLELLPIDLYPELDGRHAEVIAFVEGWMANNEPEAFWEFLSEHETFIQEVVLLADEAQEATRLITAMENERSNEARTAAFGSYFDLVMAAINDRDPPWQLLMYTAEGKPPYQYARYDGGLQGTETGMTYFYTDILAKGYFYDLGGGNPYGIVEGFLPKSQANVPWSHCTVDDQEGRIWFGLREEAVGIFPDRVHLGRVATRLFVLMQDPEFGEQEIEPSYMFGQGIWWWDRHYQAMADYEPQYHRLDQLMRWGAALAWLVEQGDILLPTVSSAEVEESWHFAQWLEAHPELTWEYQVPFVDVPEQQTESVLRLFSQPYEACGKRWVSSGGISNPSMYRIAEIANLRPELPETLARGGLSRLETDYSPTEAAGTIAGLDGIRRTLQPVEVGQALIDIVAEGRKVWSLGDVKVAMPEKTPRRMQLMISQAEEQLEWQMDVQDVRLGNLAVTTEGSRAAVRWQAGPLAKVQGVLDELQDALLEFSLDLAIEQLESIVESYVDEESGETYLLIDNGTDAPQWLAIQEGQSDEGDHLSFRLARPAADNGTDSAIIWYYARLVDGPQPEAP